MKKMLFAFASLFMAWSALAVAQEVATGTIAVQCQGEGTVSNAGTYAVGKTITLTAKPATRAYVFSGWYDATGSTPAREDYLNPSWKMTVSGDATYVAKFINKEDDQVTLDFEGKYEGLTVGDVVNAEVKVTSATSLVKSITVKGLPKGIKWDSKERKFTGVPTIPGSYTITLTTTTAAAKHTTATTFTIDNQYLLPDEILNHNSFIPGVVITPIVVPSDITAIKGLPSGLKWNKKIGCIEGAPQKPGAYNLLFTQGKGKTAQLAAATFTVTDYLPLALKVEGAETATVKGGGAYPANKKVTLRASTKDKTLIFLGWFDADGMPLAGIQDYRLPTLSYITKAAGETIVAKFASKSYYTEADLTAVNMQAQSTVFVVQPSATMEAYPTRWKEHIEVGEDVGICGFDVTSLTLPTVKVKGLPSGLKWDAKRFAITGKPKKPGFYTIEATVTNAQRKAAKLPAETFYFTVRVVNTDTLFGNDRYDPATIFTMTQDEVGNWVIDERLIALLGSVEGKLKLSGLPKGMKWKNGVLSGVPTKQGIYTITLSAGRQKATVTLVFGPLKEDGVEIALYGVEALATVIAGENTEIRALDSRFIGTYEDGRSFSLWSATADHEQYTLTLEGLPEGLALQTIQHAATRREYRLVGKTTAEKGVYPITATVVDREGLKGSAVFDLYVVDAIPALNALFEERYFGLTSDVLVTTAEGVEWQEGYLDLDWSPTSIEEGGVTLITAQGTHTLPYWKSGIRNTVGSGTSEQYYEVHFGDEERSIAIWAWYESADKGIQLYKKASACVANETSYLITVSLNGISIVWDAELKIGTDGNVELLLVPNDDAYGTIVFKGAISHDNTIVVAAALPESYGSGLGSITITDDQWHLSFVDSVESVVEKKFNNLFGEDENGNSIYDPTAVFTFTPEVGGWIVDERFKALVTSVQGGVVYENLPEGFYSEDATTFYGAPEALGPYDICVRSKTDTTKYAIVSIAFSEINMGTFELVYDTGYDGSIRVVRGEPTYARHIERGLTGWYRSENAFRLDAMSCLGSRFYNIIPRDLPEGLSLKRFDIEILNNKPQYEYVLVGETDLPAGKYEVNFDIEDPYGTVVVESVSLVVLDETPVATSAGETFFGLTNTGLVSAFNWDSKSPEKGEEAAVWVLNGKKETLPYWRSGFSHRRLFNYNYEFYFGRQQGNDISALHFHGFVASWCDSRSTTDCPFDGYYKKATLSESLSETHFLTATLSDGDPCIWEGELKVTANGEATMLLSPCNNTTLPDIQCEGWYAEDGTVLLAVTSDISAYTDAKKVYFMRRADKWVIGIDGIETESAPYNTLFDEGLYQTYGSTFSPTFSWQGVSWPDGLRELLASVSGDVVLKGLPEGITWDGTNLSGICKAPGMYTILVQSKEDATQMATLTLKIDAVNMGRFKVALHEDAEYLTILLNNNSAYNRPIGGQIVVTYDSGESYRLAFMDQLSTSYNIAISGLPDGLELTRGHASGGLFIRVITGEVNDVAPGEYKVTVTVTDRYGTQAACEMPVLLVDEIEALNACFEARPFFGLINVYRLHTEDYALDDFGKQFVEFDWTPPAASSGTFNLLNPDGTTKALSYWRGGICNSYTGLSTYNYYEAWFGDASYTAQLICYYNTGDVGGCYPKAILEEEIDETLTLTATEPNYDENGEAYLPSWAVTYTVDTAGNVSMILTPSDTTYGELTCKGAMAEDGTILALAINSDISAYGSNADRLLVTRKDNAWCFEVAEKNGPFDTSWELTVSEAEP